MNMKMVSAIGGAIVALSMSAGVAGASTFDMVASDPAIVQSSQAPCVISTQKCNGNPFYYNYNQNSGNATSFDMTMQYTTSGSTKSGSWYDGTTHTISGTSSDTIATLTGSIGNIFGLAMDLNQTKYDQIINSLTYTVVYGSGPTITASLANPLGVTPATNNGSGKSDYNSVNNLINLTGATSFTISWNMSGLNDGGESLFLYNANSTVVPIPATAFLLLGGLGGLASLKRRKRKQA